MCGKKLIFETTLGRNIMGEKYFYLTEKIDSATGRFNGAVEGKLLIILDETSTFIGDHEKNNILKSFTTQEFMNIERKNTSLGLTEFFCSIDVSDYKCSVFDSKTLTNLKEMSKSVFEHSWTFLMEQVL
jgi:hypothetical protein